MDRSGPPQPIECSRGGEPHPVPTTGGWPCKGHRSRDGRCCANSAMQGQEVCHAHGGRAPQNRRAAGRRLAEDGARRTLAEVGVDPIGDPVEALADLAAQAVALKDHFAARVAELDEYRYRSDMGTEQLRAELELYERAMDRAERFLGNLVKHGFDERRVQVAESQLDLMVGVLRGALDGLLGLVTRLVGERDAELAAAVEASWREAEPGIVRGELERAKGPEGGS